MSFSIIVAKDEYNGIGKNNTLPWDIPDDLKYFKKTTEHTTVIMGSNTYFSIPEKYRPLKNRENIVLTTNQDKKETIENEGGIVYSSIKDVIKNYSNKDCFIIGGASIYEQFINKISINNYYFTEIKGCYYCDIRFPFYSLTGFIKIHESKLRQHGEHRYKFTVYKNKTTQ
jgi:dihydrofolate reductase